MLALNHTALKAFITSEFETDERIYKNDNFHVLFIQQQQQQQNFNNKQIKSQKYCPQLARIRGGTMRAKYKK